MANALPSRPHSLVLYSDPIYTGEQLDLTKKSESQSNRVDKGDTSLNRIEDVLQAMLPPQYVPFVERELTARSFIQNVA